LRLHGSALPFAEQLRQQVSAQTFQITKLAERGWPLPLRVNARTGEPTGLRGTAAMIWISVWSELAQMGEWEDTALIRSALDHYLEAVSSGQLFGAPENVEGECVNSENIYIAINAYEGMVTEQFYFVDCSALGNSVRFLEADDRRAAYDLGPHGSNYGNLAGFSHA